MARVIAIDGPSGAGKSSVSRIVGKKLGFLHVDSGALYRIMTWQALVRKVDTDDPDAVAAFAPTVEIECRPENGAIAWNYDDVNYLSIYDAKNPERGWSRVLSNRGDIGSYASFADGHMFGYRDFTVNACYENMLKIAGAEEVAPIATFRDAYDVERTIEAVRNSWENRCWVKLADFT